MPRIVRIKVKRKKSTGLPPQVADTVKHMSEKGGKSVQVLRDFMGIETIPTGSMVLDHIIGGGVPLGQVVELRGDEGAFKTTLSLEILKSIQDSGYKGGAVAFIDIEQTLNPELARNIGIDVDRFIHLVPATGEEAFDMLEEMANGGIAGVVLDSIGAVTPEEDMTGDMTDGRLGSQSRLMWKAYREKRGVIHGSGIACVFINQKTAIIGASKYMPQEDSRGGKALKYWSFLRLDMTAGSQIKDGDKRIGQDVGVRCFKNRMAAPHQKIKIPMMFGTGIDHDREMLNAGLALGVIKKSGAWMIMPDGIKVSGAKKFVEYLNSKGNLRKKLRKAIRGAIDG
jgi:recombination protein RecA